MSVKKDPYAISFTSTTAKIPLKDKWIHSLHSGFGFQVSWVIFAYYLMYFYTDVFGISAALAGVLMLAARLFDVVTDVLIGYAIDNCSFKPGKFRSWQIYGLIPLTITFIMTFTAINTTSTALKVLWVCLSYGMFGAIGATMEFSSTTAQLANMTKNPNERSSVAAIKGATQNVAQIVAAVIFINMVKTFGGNAGNETRGFFVAAIIVAAVVAGLCVANIAMSKKYELNRDGSYREHLRSTGESYPLLQQIKDLFKIRPAVVVAGNQLVQQSLYAIRSGMMIYIFQYYWGLDGFYEMAILQYSIAMVLGALLLKPAVKLVGDTNRCFIIAKIITTVLFVTNFFAITAMDIQGSAASMQYGIVWILFMLSGLFLGMENVFAFALLPGMVDYGEWKTGKNKGGMIHSLFGLSLSLGSAVGGLIFGLLLGNSGYIANVAQSAATQKNMLVLAFIVPSVLMLLSAVIQSFYGLSDKKLAGAIAELAEQREKEHQDKQTQ